MTTRLLFLDFDGVLNSDAYFASPAYRRFAQGRSDAELMLQERESHLDPQKISLLNGLIEATGVEVVISSSWRLMHSLDELNAFLASRGATFRASAVTPRVTEYDPSRPLRAREILAYLGALPEPPVVMAALDDDDLNSLVEGHVQPHGSSGLQAHHIGECLRLLRAGQGSASPPGPLPIFVGEGETAAEEAGKAEFRA